MLNLNTFASLPPIARAYSPDLRTGIVLELSIDLFCHFHFQDKHSAKHKFILFHSMLAILIFFLLCFAQCIIQHSYFCGWESSSRHNSVDDGICWRQNQSEHSPKSLPLTHQNSPTSSTMSMTFTLAVIDWWWLSGRRTEPLVMCGNSRAVGERKR